MIELTQISSMKKTVGRRALSLSIVPQMSTCESSIQPKPWMRRVLVAAAAYNICWGAFSVLFPETMLSSLGLSPLPAYPEFWQCIGMIVGVYGIGYAIAARHPFVHWPITLVGLLGKVFGPIGFAFGLSSGRLPATMGWTIITNDLIWWIPFAVILWNAARFHQSRVEQFVVPTPVRKIDPLGRLMSQRGATLTELSRHQPLLVVFLRHSGCTFCREAVADIAAQRQAIEALGTQIAFVHMGQQEPVDLLEKHKLTDIHSFRDPVCSLYDAFGLRMGTFWELFGPKTWVRSIQSWKNGNVNGAFNGNVLRMPGVFLLQNGEVVRAYRHKSPADRPDYVKLASLPKDQPSESSEPRPLVST